MRRPDRLLVRSVGDVRNRTLWKDGETVTLLDRDENVYVQIDDPGTIDQMMDLLLSRYGVSTPLADLLSSDLQAVLTRDVETGEVVGQGYVGERRFHHLAFTQAEIDWQVWLGDGEGPPLGKFVITYKNLPGEPQYTARLSEFYALPTVAEAVFHPHLPPGAERVDLHPLPEPPPPGGGTGE